MQAVSLRRLVNPPARSSEQAPTSAGWYWAKACGHSCNEYRWKGVAFFESALQAHRPEYSYCFGPGVFACPFSVKSKGRPAPPFHILKKSSQDAKSQKLCSTLPRSSKASGASGRP